jgi:hypothetical protein
MNNIRGADRSGGHATSTSSQMVARVVSTSRRVGFAGQTALAAICSIIVP